MIHKSLEKIYEEYMQAVFRFLLSLTGNQDLSEELTQETFFRAFQHIGKFEGRCSLYTWLCQIAKNEWYMEVYEHFGYCKNGKTNVPVYNDGDYDVADKLYKFILNIVNKPLFEGLAIMQEETRLSAIAHGVAVKDIANEIYHLIFGEVNELLVQRGLAAKPKNDT